MSTGTQTPTRPAAVTAALVDQAIRHHVDHRANLLFPEAEVQYRAGNKSGIYRADFVSISRAGYATELEVKVSLADWRKDLSKPKWVGMPAWITRFVYVVPEELGIPEWVPAHAGVWHVYESHDPIRPLAIKVARTPAVLGREKVPSAVHVNWLRNLYYRYWEQRVRAEYVLAARHESPVHGDAA